MSSTSDGYMVSRKSRYNTGNKWCRKELVRNLCYPKNGVDLASNGEDVGRLPQEFQDYVNRVAAYDPVADSAAIFFENPWIWTVEEGFKMMRKVHHRFFKVGRLSERKKCLLVPFNAVWEKALPNNDRHFHRVFKSDVLDLVFKHNSTSNSKWLTKGNFVKLWRNAIEHCNSTIREKKLEERKQMNDFKAGIHGPVKSKLVYSKKKYKSFLEIHKMFMEEFNILGFTWGAVAAYYSSIDPIEKKEQILWSVEFREGFSTQYKSKGPN